MQHLFVAVPNNSGSTVLTNRLKRCANVAWMHGEGQKHFGDDGPRVGEYGVGRRFTAIEDVIADPARYDWKRIRERWHAEWSACTAYGKPECVLLEKSPPNVVRAPLLEREFDGAAFVLMTRNPYAVVEGMRRRKGFDVDASVRHWLRCAELQQRNREQLERCTYFTYEELCADPAAVERRIVELVPEVHDLRLSAGLAGRPDSDLRDRNEEQIARLEPAQVRRISDALAPHRALLERLGHGLRGTTDGRET